MKTLLSLLLLMPLLGAAQSPSWKPDKPVELIVVRGPSGPMTVARLCEAGFDATGHETFNVATSLLSDYRILVPRREVERATLTMQRFL